MLPGDYFKKFITNKPIDLTVSGILNYKKKMIKFPDEAIFIYSYKENKMLYADGWEEILGYRDEEIGMITIIDITSPEYKHFSNALNDEVFTFMQSKTENLEQYSFTMELKKIHKNGDAIPLIATIGVLKSEGGKIIETIGRYQINRSVNFGKVMRWAAYGPEKSQFEEELNTRLFHYCAISRKEKEALSLVAKGFTFKEIAYQFKVSHSAIEKRILPLYNRFDVKSLPHLISFAYENYILP